MPTLPQDDNPNPGFVSLQQYLTANQGTLGQMTKTLGDVATSQAQGALRESGQVNANTAPDALKASQYANSLTNYGGLYNDVQQQYGKGGAYTPGDASFDATLLGTAQPQHEFQSIQNKYGGLDQYLMPSTGATTSTPNQTYARAGSDPGPANQTYARAGGDPNQGTPVDYYQGKFGSRGFTSGKNNYSNPFGWGKP